MTGALRRGAAVTGGAVRGALDAPVPAEDELEPLVREAAGAPRPSTCT